MGRIHIKMGLFLKTSILPWRLFMLFLMSPGPLFCLVTAQSDPDPGYPAYDDYHDAFDAYDEEKAAAMGPSFDVPMVNVTVVAGQTAVLPCSINRISDYLVAWVSEEGITFTLQQDRIIDDSRISVLRPYIKEWNLQIFNVKHSDQGVYRCTLNTKPVMSKIVMLHVNVPSKIIEELSSNDVTVQEGETVVLVCNVTGVPRPDVTWYRKKSQGDKEKIGHIGEMIIIQNVSRYCDDEYECIAFNGVKPAVSRTIRVTVEFKPEVRLHVPRITQAVGKDTILECLITAYPLATIYWEKEGKALTSADAANYNIRQYPEHRHTITLSLAINGVARRDFGKYKCFAENKLGSDEESMYLDEAEHSTTTESVIVDISQFPTHRNDGKPVDDRRPPYIPTKAPPHGHKEKKDGQVGKISSGCCGRHLQCVFLTNTVIASLLTIVYCFSFL